MRRFRRFLFILALVPLMAASWMGLWAQGTFTGAGTISGEAQIDSTTARRFNGGGSEYLRADGYTALNSVSSALTAAAWVRYTSSTTTTYQKIMYRSTSGSDGFYNWYLSQYSTTLGDFHARVVPSGGEKSVNTSTPGLVKQWYFVVLRWQDGDYAYLHIYRLDGSLLTSAQSATVGTGSIGSVSQPLWIGSSWAGAGEWNGDIAQCYVDNTFLSDADVQVLLRGTQPHLASAGYWPLGLGSPDPDQSGHSNDMAVTGTTIVSGP